MLFVRENGDGIGGKICPQGETLGIAGIASLNAFGWYVMCVVGVGAIKKERPKHTPFHIWVDEAISGTDCRICCIKIGDEDRNSTAHSGVWAI